MYNAYYCTRDLKKPRTDIGYLGQKVQAVHKRAVVVVVFGRHMTDLRAKSINTKSSKIRRISIQFKIIFRLGRIPDNVHRSTACLEIVCGWPDFSIYRWVDIINLSLFISRQI